jgi:hypothetical protein
VDTLTVCEFVALWRSARAAHYFAVDVAVALRMALTLEKVVVV